MQQPIEKFMSSKWRIILSILIGIFTALEITRFIWRLSYFETYGWANTIIHAALVGILLVLLVLTILGRRTPSLFTVFVIAFNLLLMIIYPYNINNDGTIINNKLVAQSEFLFSLPELVFYFYLAIQAIIIAALWQYYFSEYLFLEFWKNKRSQNQIEFEKLLKNTLAEMEQNKTP
jgi:uncharacterized membrane protein YciS (DUF1049 family)